MFVAGFFSGMAAVWFVIGTAGFYYADDDDHKMVAGWCMVGAFTCACLVIATALVCSG